jgi:membrane-bound metal-dependent hydrolase YbcI (DUF457 family)
MLGQLDARRVLGPGSRAAFVLGALAPDVDLVIAAEGWDRYLSVHEGGTHTIVATPLVGLGVALAVRTFTKGSTIFRLWCASAASVLLGHLIFDLVSGSEMRLLAPFHNARLGPQWLAMADLLAFGILVSGTLIGRWWLRPRRAAIATLAALAVLLACKAYSQDRALEIVAGMGLEAVEIRKTGIEAVNGSLFEWHIHSRARNLLTTSRVNVRTHKVVVRFVRRVDAEAEAIGARVRVAAITTFLGLARLPFPRIESDNGRRFLLWSDLRHCDADHCTLSFGAELGQTGEPLREVIRVGPFEQSRPIAGSSVRHGPCGSGTTQTGLNQDIRERAAIVPCDLLDLEPGSFEPRRPSGDTVEAERARESSLHPRIEPIAGAHHREPPATRSVRLTNHEHGTDRHHPREFDQEPILGLAREEMHDVDDHRRIARRRRPLRQILLLDCRNMRKDLPCAPGDARPAFDADKLEIARGRGPRFRPPSPRAFL